MVIAVGRFTNSYRAHVGTEENAYEIRFAKEPGDLDDTCFKTSTIFENIDEAKIYYKKLYDLTKNIYDFIEKDERGCLEHLIDYLKAIDEAIQYAEKFDVTVFDNQDRDDTYPFEDG